MANVKKIRDGCYELRYRTPEGESRRKRFPRKNEAERYLINTEHRKETGTYIDPRGADDFEPLRRDVGGEQGQRPERTRINVEGRRESTSSRPSAWYVCRAFGRATCERGSPT